MKKYLLVSEGPTDHVVIKEVAKKISSEIGQTIEIVELSPQRDATSGTYPAHGWNAIQSWCKKFSNKSLESMSHLPPSAQRFLQRQNWRALLAFDNANGLLIQLDTDIAQDLKDLNVIQPGDCRKTHCKNAVLAWLNESAEADGLYLALTAHALETWILATHDPADPVFDDLPKDFNYEHIEDVEDRLISLGYASRLKRGRQRLKKSPYIIYETYAKRITADLANIRARCEAADEFCKHLEA
ncbi:hypothetical protein QIW53_13470 [Pseudomonas fluorescens]|uniref:hypothetical protein n=1 Tax=Pseudomonas fluorescens TaxID=294 RepID=UPI003524B791